MPSADVVLSIFTNAGAVHPTCACTVPKGSSCRPELIHGLMTAEIARLCGANVICMSGAAQEMYVNYSIHRIFFFFIET